MEVKNSNGRQKGRKYGDVPGLMALGALTLAAPGISFAADPSFTIASPAGAGPCYSDQGSTTTACVRPVVTFQSGHGWFTAMCFTDYTHAKTATPELAGLPDSLPGACDLFDQIFTNTPANSFANGNHPYPSLESSDNGAYHPAQANWWGTTPAYSQGDNVDAWWISPSKSAEGQKTSWHLDDPGSETAASGSTNVYYSCNSGWWGTSCNSYPTQQWWVNDTHVTSFAGHGSLDNGSPYNDGNLNETLCNKDADCSAVPAQFYAPGLCRSFPGAVPAGDTHKGVCRYNNYRFLITSTFGDSTDQNGNYQVNGFPRFRNQVNLSGGQVRLGNSQFAGGWAQSGTDGGTNWVILQAENTVMPGLLATQWGRLFAGVHFVSATMNVSGANANVTNPVYQDNTRLLYTFLQFNANLATSVTLAWDASMNSIPLNHGTGCGTDPANFTAGGGQGFNGCGCMVTMAVDTTQAAAVSRVTTETYQTIIQDDSKDVAGAGGYSYRFLCNYKGGPAGASPAYQYQWNNP